MADYLEILIKRLQRYSLPIRLKLWNGHNIDLSPEPRVTINLSQPSALKYLLNPNFATLGSAYVEGHVQVEGSINEIFHIGEQLVTQGHRPPPGKNKWEAFLQWFRNERDDQAIRYHYDLSNDFYKLWLDRNMVYSCAYFKTDTDSLDTAQEQKLDHICRKLMLKPNEKFLDIGCGWGGLILWAAQHYGVRAVGITLSKKQFEFASSRIQALGLSHRCKVLLCDYRDLLKNSESQYDKIASVGMFEHVGLKNLGIYFRAAYHVLKPGGLMLNHGITALNPNNGAVGLGVGEFINRYVFPKGELPHLALVVTEMSRREFEVVDVESLRPHYAKTLSHWVNRLEKRKEEAEKLVGNKDYRIWALYMAGCAHAFKHAWISIYQVLAVKPEVEGTHSLPLTRDYMYAPEELSANQRYG